MKYVEQMERLEQIIEQIRILQENGLWEPLQDAKILCHKLYEKLKIDKEKNHETH